MCATISIKEFAKYLATSPITKVLFASCDQINSEKDHHMDFYLEFHKVIIPKTEDAIHLIGVSGRMRVGEVQSITINDSCSVLGSVAEISCGYPDGNVKYKICLCD